MFILKKTLSLLTVVLILKAGIFSQTRPWGRMIDIGSTKLHLYCTGQGSPTIILGYGSGGWSIHSLEIQKKLSKKTRVCSYDRAGFGWSSDDSMPRTARQDAIELHQLLERSREKPPFVLAGISYSGYIARIYYDMFPENIAGIALIESGHENQWKNLPAAREMLELGLPEIKERFKKAREGQIKKEEFQTNLPPELVPLYQEAMMQTKNQKAFVSTMENIYTSAEQLGKTKKLGDLPLVVLSAGNSFAQFIEENEKNKPLLEELNKGWMEMQFDLARLSTNSEHLIIPDARHDIVAERPLLAAAAINILLEKIKK